MKKLIYLSSPFTKGDQSANVKVHIDTFFEASKLHPDAVFYAPLVWCATPWAKELNEEQWLEYDINMLAHCDAICMFGKWEDSVGCCLEFRNAERLGIPVVTLEELGLVPPDQIGSPK